MRTIRTAQLRRGLAEHGVRLCSSVRVVSVRTLKCGTAEVANGFRSAVDPKGSLMDLCVYTTQHDTWLHAALDCPPTQLVCFRSVKRWKTARQLLTSHTTLPVLFRKQDETTPILACHFVAELIEIHFADQFATDRARLAWLEDRLWLQRNKIKSHHPKYRTWQEQFKVEEIDNFMKAMTWFSVRDVRKIESLPLPRLRKLKDNRPLSSRFVRGYALCRYPKDEIRTIGKTGPAA